jgi:predicted acyltransferase
MSNSLEKNLGETGNSGMSVKRLSSIDALRGFTMIWIIGAEEVVRSFFKVWPNSLTETFAVHMTHAKWEGYYFYDLIFPLFLFLVGVLLPFTVLRRIEAGVPPKQLYQHIIKRTLVLIFLGLVNYGLLRFDWPAMRWSSVLGRIGICYFFASILVIHTNWRTQAMVTAAILVGYYLAVMFVPVPGYGAGVLTPDGCLTTYLDQKIIPGALGMGIYDRQGILSTFTALATTTIGVLAGYWLRSDRPENHKTTGLVFAGIATLAAGWIWGQFFFISRNVWSSSFVLYSAGWSFFLLALFYWIIDVKGYKRWSFFLIVIGMNAITIWVGQRLVDFEFTANSLFLGFSNMLGIIQPIFIAIAVFMLKWLFLWFLYKYKIFLKA